MGMIHHVKGAPARRAGGRGRLDGDGFNARASVKVTDANTQKANEKKRGGDSQQSST